MTFYWNNILLKIGEMIEFWNGIIIYYGTICLMGFANQEMME